PVGNVAVRDALMRNRPKNAVREEIIGVTLDVQTGDNIPAPDIDFGSLQVKGAHITFGDMYLFQHWKLTDEPTLTLGMDLLGSFDVLVIDYNRHELQIRSRQAPVLPYSLRYWSARPAIRALIAHMTAAAASGGSAAALSH